MEISEQLKARRRARGHTQDQAAKAMGVKLRTYQGWEAGDHVEALERAIRVLAYLDTDTDTNQESASG